MCLCMDLDVIQVELFLWIDVDWCGVYDIGGELVFVFGIDLCVNGLMFLCILLFVLCVWLVELDVVIVDCVDIDKFGVVIGDYVVINGYCVCVVGVSSGLCVLGGVNVVSLLDIVCWFDIDLIDVGCFIYLVVVLCDLVSVDVVVVCLCGDCSFGLYDVWMVKLFVCCLVLYWMFDIGVGVGVVFLVGIVFLVGVVIISQMLMVVVVGLVCEYVMFNVLGVGVVNLCWVVLEQVFWVGVIGLFGVIVLGVLLLELVCSQDVLVVFSILIILLCVVLVMVLVVVFGLVVMCSLCCVDLVSLL